MFLKKIAISNIFQLLALLGHFTFGLLMAYYFGASREMDAYVVALNFINAISALFTSSQTSSFIPFISNCADRKEREACGFFADGLDAFRNMLWDEAVEKFRRSAELIGEDEPSRFYINLCGGYRINPPEGTWDGVVNMDKK